MRRAIINANVSLHWLVSQEERQRAAVTRLQMSAQEKMGAEAYLHTIAAEVKEVMDEVRGCQLLGG